MGVDGFALAGPKDHAARREPPADRLRVIAAIQGGTDCSEGHIHHEHPIWANHAACLGDSQGAVEARPVPPASRERLAELCLRIPASGFHPGCRLDREWPPRTRSLVWRSREYLGRPALTATD